MPPSCGTRGKGQLRLQILTAEELEIRLSVSSLGPSAHIDAARLSAAAEPLLSSRSSAASVPSHPYGSSAARTLDYLFRNYLDPGFEYTGRANGDPTEKFLRSVERASSQVWYGTSTILSTGW